MTSSHTYKCITLSGTKDRIMMRVKSKGEPVLDYGNDRWRRQQHCPCVTLKNNNIISSLPSIMTPLPPGYVPGSSTSLLLSLETLNLSRYHFKKCMDDICCNKIFINILSSKWFNQKKLNYLNKNNKSCSFRLSQSSYKKFMCEDFEFLLILDSYWEC